MDAVLLMVIGAVLYFASGQVAALFRREDRIKREVNNSVLTMLDINPKSSLTRAELAQAERERLITTEGVPFKIIGIIIFNIGVLVLLI